MSQIIQSTIQQGFSIDTSALIDIKNLPRDIFETLWKNIEKMVRNSLLIAPKEVLVELNRRDDFISQWAKKHSCMFINLEPIQIREVSIILAKFPNLVDINKIPAEADPFVIALAKSKGWGVVTSEKPRSVPNARPKIPDVCNYYNIECYSLFNFCRKMGWKF